MTTNDYFSLAFNEKQNIVNKNNTSNDQYSNLNLNQNIQNSFDDAFFSHPKNVVTEKKNFLNYGFTKNNELENILHGWNKSTNELSPTFVNNVYDFVKENRLKKGTSSTLSLHIETYENLIQANLFDGTKKCLIKKQENAKQIFVDLKTAVIQNPLEFPRQQESSGEDKKPEVAQFRTSQRLLNPNQMNRPYYRQHVQQSSFGFFNMQSRFPPPSRPSLQQQPSEKALRSVYVGNIGFDVNEEELKQILANIGPVIGFRIVHDRETGKSKGFGFCEFLDPDTANRCIRQLNNLEFKGRNLRIDSAVLNERAMNDDFVPSSSQNHHPMTSMRPRSPHDETSMYGPAPLNGKTPEAISKTLSKCSPEIMFEVMRDMKNLATTNPQRCRQLLETNQQLAFALLQAQVMMHWLDTDAAFNLIDRKPAQEKTAEPAAPIPEPSSHVQTRQPLRPTPSQAPAPFRPPPPSESQFFQHTPPLPPQQQQQQQQFRQQFFPPPPQQQQPPLQRPPPSSSGPWSSGGPPPQRMSNAPPPQRFPQNQNFDRFPPPSMNDGPGFNDNFRNFGNRPSGPPSGFHSMPPPPQRGHFPPPQSQGGFRPNMPQQQQHFQPPPQRQSNDAPPEDDADDYEMIEQLLQLTDDQINQLPAHEAAKIREIRAQLAHR